jgi:hypothetical protein
MTHLHEMNNPKTSIDVVGWLFVTVVIAITAIAGTVTYVIATAP